MKRTLLLTISILLLTVAPMSAQQRGGSPKPKPTHAAPKVKTHVSGASTVKAAKTTRGGGHAPKTTARASSVKITKAAKTTKASKTTATTTARSTTTLSPVQ